ncbi:RhuM family protein [Pseudoalteromonas sp. OOF1S-7]|uniref:RhuM family protein n=1 Tax=Pseudoalteromonas sp. OOF1S-7 TaxID=2917757 RepID=UPI001EF4C452|nr:RhuM family protein [Pseudoalteromonas sp. OOF1S-7]MCG7536113.1 virulence RhuM family protein [Pseudoalteromonas sp. OOF1S-7]
MTNKNLTIQDQTTEIIVLKADASQPFMGITTYKSSPKGQVLKLDTAIAKNCLSEEEIKKLERAVSAFVDYIEGILERLNTFTMEAFAQSVNKLLGQGNKNKGSA